MEAAKLYNGGLPLYERFIPKSARAAAPSGSFAGKGKSFPILKPEDVQAAVHAIGRAGPENYSADVLKKNIIRIAKEKGWSSSLPKAWQGGGDDATGKEAIQDAKTGLRLVESAAFVSDIPLQEAAVRTDYPIRIITPGTGTSAHYTAAMLQKEAAKFKPGTLMFWNHPTAAEEAARPEGNLDHLAAITTSQGEWRADGAKGPGIYANAKVMADYAEKVAERAPHIGISIRAGGHADGESRIDGKPVLKEFSYIESVDYVTKAGRGGLALAEAARGAGLLTEAARGAATQTEEVSMTDAEVKLLKESVAANTAITEALQLKETRREAIAEGAKTLRDVALPAQAKEYIIESVLRNPLPLKDGALDTVKLTEAVNAEASRFAAATGQAQRVTGMGVAATVDTKEAERRAAAAKDQDAEDLRVFESLMDGNKEAAKLALQGRVM
jgi:hypothetical protein